jgi:hypothetical protein
MNWGRFITFIYLAFVAGIIYLVYGSLQQDISLVDEDYYQKELAFQKEIDQSNRAVQSNQIVKVEETGNGYWIKVDSAQGSHFVADVHFYCPASKEKDKLFHFDSQNQAKWWIPSNKIQPGSYTIKTRWIADSKDTLMQETAFIK